MREVFFCLRLVGLCQDAEFTLTWLWHSKGNGNTSALTVRQNNCISTHFSVMPSLMTRKNRHANNQSTAEHLILIRNHQVVQLSAPGWITVLFVRLENSASLKKKKRNEHGQAPNLLTYVSIMTHKGNIERLEGKVDLEALLFFKSFFLLFLLYF